MRKLLSVQKNLISVMSALTIYRLSTSMIGVFIPLIILKSGGQLWMITSFYLLYAVAKFFLNYNAMQLIQKKGTYIGLGLGFGFGITQLVIILTYTIFHNPFLLVAGAVSLAFTNAFLWNAQHFFISQVMEKSTRSSSIATIEIISQCFGIGGPIIGGFIGLQYGPFWLLISTVAISFATIIPLLQMKKVFNSIPIIKLKYNLHGAPKRDLVANFCFNVETTIGGMLWPIYLAVVLHTFGVIGVIASLAATASIIATWIAGRRGDKGKDRSVLFQGIGIVSVINIIRIFVHTPLTVGLVSAVYQSSLSYLQNSWSSTYYLHAKERGPQYIISMEIACDLAYVFVWGLLSVILFITNNHNIFFIVSFMIASIAAWGCLLISKGEMQENINYE
jgi:MFS family permease